MSIYCGNNSRSPELRNGKVIGTRYKCFKKGVGIGINQPYDPAYKSRFKPIDARKIYCGEAVRLPIGYDIMGNNPMCLQKGVGVGKKIRAKKENPKKPKKSKKKKSKKPKKPKKAKSKKLKKVKKK